MCQLTQNWHNSSCFVLRGNVDASPIAAAPRPAGQRQCVILARSSRQVSPVSRRRTQAETPIIPPVRISRTSSSRSQAVHRSRPSLQERELFLLMPTGFRRRERRLLVGDRCPLCGEPAIDVEKAPLLLGQVGRSPRRGGDDRNSRPGKTSLFGRRPRPTWTKDQTDHCMGRHPAAADPDRRNYPTLLLDGAPRYSAKRSRCSSRLPLSAFNTSNRL